MTIPERIREAARLACEPARTERFYSLAIPEPNSGCWLWLGAIWRGYGYLPWPDKDRGAHRFSYMLHRGPIPVGFEIDHLCRTPGCVNPDHLEAVTPVENTRRGNAWSAKNRRKTHCDHGHEFTAENTFYRMSRGISCRQCRMCERARSQRKNARRRAMMKYDQRGEERQ